MGFINLLLSGLIFMRTSNIFTEFDPEMRNLSRDAECQFFPKLHDYIIPQHYNIKLVPYVEQNIFYGECNIDINILRETKYINLHSDIKCITSVVLTDNPPRFQKYDKEKMIVYRPAIYLYNNKTHISEFTFDNELSSGHYILQIKFVGAIADDKGFRILPSNENKNEMWIAATHFQIIGAQKMFPCWNVPTLRATFNISLMSSDGCMVFSNMPEQEKEMIGNGKMWTHFHITPEMPSYLVAAVAVDRSKFSYLRGSENANIWHRLNVLYYISYAQNVIKNITLYLESEWKRPKVSKINHVVIPNFHDENMINVGLVLHRESDILYYHEFDPIARKMEIAYLIGQKIMEEWFYNMFNTSWCSCEWLNEALIPFIGLYAVDKALPNSRMMDLFVVQFLQDYLHLDADPSMWPVTSRTNGSFEVPRCIKALIYLRTLQSSYPEKEFWNNIRRYIYNNEPSYDVFRKIILPEDNTSQHIKLLTMILDTINSWIKQKHYPVINAMRDYDNPELPMNVSIQNFNTSSDYYIPITVQEPYDSDISFDILLKGPHKFPFKKDSWIILNKQQTGYYRVKYDFENWRRLLNDLDSENYIKIHVLNRAQIIDDAFHLMIAHQINSSIFWNLTNYLSRETDYVAWYPMFKALEYMSSVFPLPKKEVDDIKVIMRKILNTLLEKLQYEEISNNEHDFNKCLRQEAAKWACIFDDSKCKTEANNKLNQHLAKSTYKLLPWWKEWTYCNGLSVSGAESIWWKVHRISIDDLDNKILKFLACSGNSNIIIEYLYLLEDTFMEPSNHPEAHLNLQTEKHYINSFFLTITKHAKNNEILTFLLTNFEKIKLRQIYTIATLTIIINSIYSEEQLDEISKFLNNSLMRKKIVDAGTMSLKNEEYKFLENVVQHTLKIRNKMKIRQSEIEIQIKYLESLGPIKIFGK